MHESRKAGRATPGSPQLRSCSTFRYSHTTVTSRIGPYQPSLSFAMRHSTGEHDRDPESVKFCHRLGLNYISCSPFRVPISRLAAAQAAVGDAKERDKQMVVA